LWFITLAYRHPPDQQQPAILAALNPIHAWTFDRARWHLFAAVGAIVLSLTGARPCTPIWAIWPQAIRLAWTVLVFPALALQLHGPGRAPDARPTAIENPFFRLFPEALMLPASCWRAAAVIASQAVISGAYSMTKQAIQLGFLRAWSCTTPRRRGRQIYLPGVNWALLIGVVAAVLLFGSSSALAGAYGIAVTLTMMIRRC